MTSVGLKFGGHKHHLAVYRTISSHAALALFGESLEVDGNVLHGVNCILPLGSHARKKRRPGKKTQETITKNHPSDSPDVGHVF